MVLVQFRVRVPDVERFKATQAKYLPTMEELGGRNNRAYYAESDPNEVTTFSEWESHDAMMARPTSSARTSTAMPAPRASSGRRVSGTSCSAAAARQPSAKSA